MLSRRARFPARGHFGAVASKSRFESPGDGDNVDPARRFVEPVAVKQFHLLQILAAAVWAGLAISSPAAEVCVAPAAAGEALSADFTVTVGGVTAPVYIAKVASKDPVLRFKSVDDVAASGTYFEKAAFASFDFDGITDVTVACPEVVTSAKILPSSYGITPVINGKQVSFKLSKPCQLTLEVNGDWVHSLHLFGNALETGVPGTNDANVIFFGPGIHEIDELAVTSGKTVYLADGAILRARPTPHHLPSVSLVGNNITLRGRGIIDGSQCPIHTQHLLSIRGTNIVVDGVTLRDSSVWTVPVRESQNVKITNLKLFGHRANSDGIDICDSRDVLVSNCFLRTLDDLVVIKTEGQAPAENIVVKKCVLWNEIAHALSIGAELRKPVSNVLFSDCDVIHDKGREWTLRVFQCDSSLISNVTFENIRIEETRQLASLWIGRFVWSRDSERGHVQNITFKDIEATGAPAKIELQGFDAGHRVEDVRFQNVRVNGKAIVERDIQQNEFVRQVTVKP